MRAKWFLTACICGVLIGLTLLVYYPVIFCDFVTYDDPIYVSENQRVLEGLSSKGWTYAWTTFDCGNWHPLTWLSLELDGSIWGKNPSGYHATNLVLHLLNSALMFVLLNQLTKNLPCSFVVAALFALHPLHVESIAWIAERKDVLSTLFLLLTILAYLRYVRRPSVVRYGLVLLLFAAGLLAKPMLVTLPILLILLDIWPLNRIQTSDVKPGVTAIPQQTFKRVVVEKLPLLCLAFADGLVTISAQKGATVYLRHLPISVRAANAFDSYAWYLHKTLIPVDLIPFYPHSELGLSWTAVATSMIVFAGITLIAVLCRRTRPHLLVGWAWFVISLLPVIGLLQVGAQSHADRYAYIPHIGLFLAIVWELDFLLSKSKSGQWAFAAVCIAAIISCGILTRTQLAYWKNGNTLWTHALDVMPDNNVAHAHLADIRFEEGRFEQALEHIEKGHHIERGLRENNSAYIANAYYNWGRCLMALNRTAEAEEKFREALKTDPQHEGTLNEISMLLQKQGRREEAALHAEAVAKWAKSRPQNPAALMSLGLAEARQGNLDAAISYFKKAVQLAPRSAEAYSNLGLALAQANRLAEAKTCFLRVLELNPKVASAHFTLAQIYEELQDLPNAKKHFAEALRLDPKDLDAKKNLDRLSSK